MCVVRFVHRELLLIQPKFEDWLIFKLTINENENDQTVILFSSIL